MNSSNPWKQRLEQVPEMEPYLRKIAVKWAKGNPLPTRMILGPEPKTPAVRAALDRIFGGRLFYSNGKVLAEIPAELRYEATLVALANELGIKQDPVPKETPPTATILQRLRLIHPQMTQIHHWLSTSPEIERLLRKSPEQEQLLRHLLETASFLLKEGKPVTLSKLGSIFFNDSKILRSGTPRNLLGGIMNCQLGAEDTPENRAIALQQFGVIDNPATTTATLFGNIQLILNGRPDNWIADRFNLGEPVTLNSYNLKDIDAVHLPQNTTVITSENAAPFHELIAERPEAILLYIAGYPNAAVCRLLRLFHEAGAICQHWGDTDPDGFMIAAIVNRYIETTLYRCGTENILTNQKNLKPLTALQLMRGRQLLKTNPHFKFKIELELSLKLGGWLEQESSKLNEQPTF